MVYEKKRSGDPDYDDKQPPEFHAGGAVVSAGDGVILSKVLGPVDADGAHASLVTSTEDLDNRPEPGGVAEAGSIVQDYKPEDTPTMGEEVEADSADVDQVKAGQESVNLANLENSGVPGLQTGTGQADESRTRSADVSASEAGSASSAREEDSRSVPTSGRSTSSTRDDDSRSVSPPTKSTGPAKK